MTDTIRPLVESTVTTFANSILFDRGTPEQCDTLQRELSSQLPNNDISVVWDNDKLKVYVKDGERFRCFETTFTATPVQLEFE
jgi:hypothetical protein